MITSSLCFADTYWLFRNFIINIEVYSSVLLDTYDKFINYLHDHESELFEHLSNNGIVLNIDKNSKSQSSHQSSSSSSSNHHHHFPHHSSTFHHQHYPQQLQFSPLNQYFSYSQNLSPNVLFSSPTLTPTSIAIQKTPFKHSKAQLKTAHDWKYKFDVRRPLITWFVRFFSGFIHQNFIIRFVASYRNLLNFLIFIFFRIFDKIICCFVHEARTFHVLFSIAKSLISHTKHELLKCTSFEQITQRLFKVC